jgi:putative FmdB family regulatory protein
LIAVNGGYGGVPLYEYQCETDGRFEVIRKFSDPPLHACPTCGQPVEKLLSSPAIQFKGTGWYITDYARKGTGNGSCKAESGKDASSSDASSSKEGASDSKSSSSSTPTTTTKDNAAKSSGSNT